MKYAKPIQRIVAYWADFIFTVTFVLLCGRIFWEIVPGSEIRADAMQLYTEKDFYNFCVTSVFSAIVLMVYNIGMPLSKFGGTFGQFIAKIKLTEVDGTTLKLKTSLKRISFILLKYILIVALGPIAAYLDFNFAISVALTLLGIVLILVPFSFLAWLDSERAGPIERLCGYRFIIR